MPDILSLISVGMGGHSVASGYALGKKLESVLARLEHLDRTVTSISDDLFLAKPGLVVSEYVAKGHILTDIEEIKRSISRLNETGIDSFLTGQRALPTSTEQAMRSDPWRFLREVRPLQGARLENKDGLPIVFEFEGIKFVGWKREREVKAEFSFQRDRKTGIWIPMPYTNIRRNERCPCGSELRYKHCCGRLL